jgi:integrase
MARRAPRAGLSRQSPGRWRRARGAAGAALDASVSEVTTAKAYRLLKAILNTALDDGVIRRNLCRIKGAGREKSEERPTLTITQVYALADAVGQRYRALVLLTIFTSPRWSELAALGRRDVDLKARTVRFHRQLAEVRGGFSFGPPKSLAGRRTVTIPDVIIPAIRWHLGCFTADDEDALIFTSPTGTPLRHRNSGAASGCPRSWRPGSPISTFTTCAIPGTRWQFFMRERPCGS